MLSAGGLTACGGAEVPEAPNLDRLEAIYRAPPGTVPELELELLVEAAQRDIELVHTLGHARVVVSLLEDASKSLQKISLDEDGDVIELRGGAKTNRQCEGWSDEDRENGDAGQIELTIPIEDSAIHEVVFGNLDGCRFVGDRGPAALTASTALSLGRNVPLVDLEFDRFVLVTLKGELATNEELDDDASQAKKEKIDFDFRVDADLFTEVRVPAEGGDVVFGTDEEERVLLLREAKGSFCCYPATRSCHALGAAVCPEEPDGEAALTW